MSATLSTSAAGVELAAGEVDAHEDRLAVGSRRLPTLRLAARLLDHPHADGHDEAGLFGDVDELRRHERAALGMLPAQQRLDADDEAALEVDGRLVDDAQLVAVERAAQRGLDVEAFDERRAHAFVVDLVARPASLLREVHGGVGVADHRFGFGVGVGERDADAHRREHLRRLDGERLVHRAIGALGDGDGVVLGHELVAQDHELVAAEAGDGVARAKRIAQPLRQRHQQAVAGAVAEAVVHDLEVVDVAEQHRHRPVAAAAAGQAPARAGRGTTCGSGGR